MRGTRDAKGAVLVTGGAGYIGSHTAEALARRGLHPVVYDNLSSGHPEAVCWGEFVHGDVRDEAALRDAIQRFGIRSIIHFAGLIEVGRSVSRPDIFYDHNVTAVATLLRAMRACKVERLVFSSSAAVYAPAQESSRLSTLAEDSPVNPSSPYGETKLAAERMIAAHCAAFGHVGIALRYFNAAGADPSARIGEAHRPETHLIPLALAAAMGGKPLTVFGRDFETPDGSCVRDYVHVSDLAEAHVAALSVSAAPGSFEALNLGTGRGYTVLQVIASIERAIGGPVLHVVGARRGGDPASLVANPRLAQRRLDWTAQRPDLDRIIDDALRWHRAQKFGPRLFDPALPSPRRNQPNAA